MPFGNVIDTVLLNASRECCRWACEITAETIVCAELVGRAIRRRPRTRENCLWVIHDYISRRGSRSVNRQRSDHAGWAMVIVIVNRNNLVEICSGHADGNAERSGSS